MPLLFRTTRSHPIASLKILAENCKKAVANRHTRKSMRYTDLGKAGPIASDAAKEKSTEATALLATNRNKSGTPAKMRRLLCRPAQWNTGAFTRITRKSALANRGAT